jgi:hypothetical protein
VIRTLVDQLSDDRFAVREQASRELARLAGGSRGLLKQVKIDDPEVTWRLRKILVAVERGPTPVASAGRPLRLKESLACLAVHPDGRHWIAVSGSSLAAKLVVGRFTQAGPRIVREIKCAHAPTTLRISDDGRRILAANGDGTVSVFAW